MALSKDNEIRVLRRITIDLDRLDDAGRRRVLDYLNARFPWTPIVGALVSSETLAPVDFMGTHRERS